MAVKFAIFSTNKGASLNPWALDPAPTTLIDLGEEPIWGFDPNAGAKGRGCRIQTLGGAVDQDFGVNVKDQVLKISVQDAKIAASVIAALDTAFGTVDGEYFMTNTVNCWKVMFAKPGGFIWAPNLFVKSALSEDVFSYEITLKVVSKDI